MTFAPISPPLNLVITPYESLFSTHPGQPLNLTWTALVAYLSSYTVLDTKEKAPGFGAHVLGAPQLKATELTLPRRSSASVDRVTLFVFDVDIGTFEDIQRTEGLLRDAGQAAHFYSSYSFHPDHPTPPFRLVIPPSRPILKSEYAAARTYLIEHFKIPCDPSKCSSPSHFWFLPSHPPGVEPLVQTIEGTPFKLDDVAILGTGPSWTQGSVPVFFEPPPETDPSEPVDLTPLQRRIEKRATRLAREGDIRKSNYLKRLLLGEALAEHGDRNHATFVTAGSVTWLLPDTPLSHLILLFRPSLEAMISAGSKITESKLERMLLTAMEKREHETRELEDAMASLRRTKDTIEARAMGLDTHVTK